MRDYWKSNPDIEADTGKNVLRYYREAGKLQVCMPNWTNDAGEEKQGKTVGVDLDALAECPEAVELLKKVLADIAD